MVEDLWSSALEVSVVFSSSRETPSSSSNGALSEVDHSFGEVGDIGELADSELLNFADILSFLEVDRVQLEMQLYRDFAHFVLSIPTMICEAAPSPIMHVPLS